MEKIKLLEITCKYPIVCYKCEPLIKMNELIEAINKLIDLIKR